MTTSRQGCVGAEKPRVLVAEDDPAMRLFLRRTLELDDCQVVVAENGHGAVLEAQRGSYDLLLLDVMMPGIDGIEVCRRMRAVSAVPILMLTALGDEQEVIRGLDTGADDYLVKPFATGELLARVRSALRRARLNSDPPPPVRTGGLVVDVEQHTVSVDGRVVDLTPTERRLVVYMARHIGRVLTVDRLLKHVWGPGYHDDARLVQVNISRLRHKIEPDPSCPTYVQTLPGIGYSLARIGDYESSQ